MSTNIELITDSTCSLPPSLLNKYHVKQTPLSISINDRKFKDPCNEKKTLALFESGRLSKKYDVSTEPPSPEAFEKMILKAVQQGNDMIVVQTVNRTQGETYNNANIAVTSVKKKLENKCKATIRVMDSRTVFAGQALMATETLRLVSSGKDSSEVKRYMDNLSEYIHTFILPKEPLLAFERARKRNMKAVGWTQAFVADTLGIHPIICNVNDTAYLAAKHFGFKKSARKLFEHACDRIDKGLYCPIVTINYAGLLSELEDLPGYEALKEKTKEKNIKLLTSMMSIAGGIYTSVGSISLAFACEHHEGEMK